MGNCGVGIAPCRPAARDWLTDDLVTVEGIDKEVLVEGIKWEWETFPEYLDAADARGSALNLAFLAPITPLRTYVLGAQANERAATAVETKAIAVLLDKAMRARGVSAPPPTASTSATAASRWSPPREPRELAAYGGILKRLGARRRLALTGYATLADDEEDLLKFLLDATGRPVTSCR
jgi:N-acyl-D-aspartate/D-glutamate deacylase